jgi:hypothetical protein
MRSRYPEVWPAFAEACCERFGHDSFTANTWERFMTWAHVNVPKIEPLPPGWRRRDEIAHLKQLAAIALLRARDEGGPPTGTDGNGNRAEPSLSRDQRWLLVAALRLSAIHSDSRKNAKVLLIKARGEFDKPANVKKALSRLVREGLLDSRTGRGGGYWLTPAGKLRAERLKGPDAPSG